ncbi:MAG: hypothetical protein WDZ50_07755 [Woeseia sp.]
MTDKPPSKNLRQEMSEWLKIMLQEIDRKSDEQSRAETEHRRRSGEPVASPRAASPKVTPENLG